MDPFGYKVADKKFASPLRRLCCNLQLASTLDILFLLYKVTDKPPLGQILLSASQSPIIKEVFSKEEGLLLLRCIFAFFFFKGICC